jgi:hypothetical protein
VHTHSFPEQVSSGVQVLGQLTVSPQVLVLLPHSTIAQVCVGVWLQTHVFPEQVSSGVQVLGQLTVSPQLLVVSPHATVAQA